jgi:hypothetical protein
MTALSQAGIEISIISTHMYIIIGSLALTFVIAFGWGAKEVVADLLKNYYNRGVINIGDTISYKDINGEVSKITKTSILIDTKDGTVVIPSKDFYIASYTITKK